LIPAHYGPGLTLAGLTLRRKVSYVASVKPSGDGQSHTAVYLTHAGRAALERYTATLRKLLDQANP